MRYYILSLLPIFMCPLLCLMPRRWMEVYFSTQYFYLVGIYFVGIYIISRIIVEIKYVSYISILVSPFSFVTSLFVIFYTADNYDITKLPKLLAHYEMIVTHLIYVALCGVFVKKFLSKKRVN